MPRILYWNVNNFGTGRFFDQQYRKARSNKKGQGKLTDIEAARARLDCLMDSITENPPDIIVIVEVDRGTTNLNEGEIVDERASYNLMMELREVTNEPWCLVPPLISGTDGRAEGIAVFYNSTDLFFTGPWRWPGGNGPSASNIIDANLRYYQQPYAWRTDPDSNPGPANPVNPNDPDNALPNRLIPADSEINPGIPECLVAGQWNYFVNGNPANAQLNFPAQGFRRPFMVTFYDSSEGAGGSNHRIIRLLAFHASPHQTQDNATNTGIVAGPAATGTARLANIFEMNQANLPNEIKVIVGDFNVPLWDVQGIALPAIAYNPIIALGYTQQLAQVPDQYPQKAYRITHVRPAQDATPYNNNDFPAFGYMSETDQFGRYDAIDNIFVKYPPGEGPALNMTIVNRVAGSPYEGVNLPALPVGVPADTAGDLTYSQYLTNPDSLPIPGGINYPDNDVRNIFKAWRNFKLIRSTSDHMALIIDV